jgi:hypothetical protein
MSDIIDNLLKQESVNEKLKDYIYISINNFDQVPLGSHIKFIDRDENIKTGGFLIKFVKNKDRTKCYYILKSNIIYKLYIYYFWVFYKDITHESNISKAIKSLKNNIDNSELKESTNDTFDKQLKVSESDSQKNSSTTMNIIIKNNKKDNKDKKNKILSKSVEEVVKEEDVKEENIVEEDVKEDKKNKKRNNSKREAFLSLLNSLNKNN